MARYILLKAFHPTAYEKGVYSVSYRVPGKPLVDRYTKHFMVKARNRKEAMAKSRAMIK